MGDPPIPANAQNFLIRTAVAHALLRAASRLVSMLGLEPSVETSLDAADMNVRATGCYANADCDNPAFKYHGLAPVIAALTELIFFTPSVDNQSSSA